MLSIRPLKKWANIHKIRLKSHPITINKYNPMDSSYDIKICDIGLPECNKCAYYLPNIYCSYNNTDHAKCRKFGKKNIYSGKINYNTIKDCRSDDTKCGKMGFQFIQPPNLQHRINEHDSQPILLSCGIIIFTTCVSSL